MEFRLWRDGTMAMGLTATFIACRAGAEPAVGSPWTPLPDAAEGWVLRESRLVPDDVEELAAVLSDVPGPALAAFVLMSDVCVVVGAFDGTPALEWTFNDEYDQGGGLAAVANDPSVDLDAAVATRMRAAVPRIAAWAEGAGLGAVARDRLEGVLERGYVCAEDGLFALLDELGVTVPAAPTCGEPRNDIPTSGREQPAGDDLVPPAPDPAPAAAAAHAPQSVSHGFIAAPIDHASAGWQRLVRTHELEAWGQPPALVAEGWSGGSGGILWLMYLACDPPLSVTVANTAPGEDAAAGRPQLDWEGSWVQVPDEPARSLTGAIAWARANIGVEGAPPRPDREPLWRELPAAERQGVRPFLREDPSAWMRPDRAGPVRLHVELDGYEDLLEHGDTLADWLQAARTDLIDPVTGQPDVRLTTRVTDGPPYGEPYGMVLTLTTWTLKQRLRLLPGDGDGWARMLDQLRRGQLRNLRVDLEILDGEGIPSQRRSGVRLEVVLRDQFAGDAGPLPDRHPARVLITLGAPAARGGAIPDRTMAAVALAKQAATTLGAVTGFVAAGRDELQDNRSPYEELVGDDWLRRPRLDTVTRGAHWGTFLSTRHLEQVGGIQALRDLGLFHTIEQLDSSPRELVWAQLTPDPYQVDQTLLDTMARELAPAMPQSRSRPARR